MTKYQTYQQALIILWGRWKVFSCYQEFFPWSYSHRKRASKGFDIETALFNDIIRQ